MKETSKELAGKIRAELRELGYSNRDISVRVEGTGWYEGVRIIVKNPSVDMEKVKEVTKKYGFFGVYRP